MPGDKLGLMWVGSKFYPTPEAFSKEAHSMGLSKRIAQIPKGLVIGETWILLGHRQAVKKPDGEKVAGIFQAFKPNAIEYIVKGDETEEELERLEKRGLILMRLETDQKEKGLFG